MSPQPSAMVKRLDLGHVAGLRALRTVDDLELHRLAFLERTEAVALNGRVVHEDVTASVALDEPVPLGVVEPLDLACDAHRSSLLAMTGTSRVGKSTPVDAWPALQPDRARRSKKGRVMRPFPFDARPAPASAQ